MKTALGHDPQRLYSFSPALGLNFLDSTQHLIQPDYVATVKEYLNHAQLGLHKRSLLKQKRAKWYMAERRDSPPILFTYLGRGNTRFIHNAAGAQALNVFLLVYPDETIAQDPDKVRALTAILNSSPIKQQLYLVGRTYGGNTVKLEPREMDKLPVLDPRLLSPDELERINHQFSMLCLSPNDPHRRTTLDNEVANLIAKYEDQAHEGLQEKLF